MPKSDRPSLLFRQSRRYQALPVKPPNAGTMWVYDWRVVDITTGEELANFKFEEDAIRYAADLHNGLIKRPWAKPQNPFDDFEPDVAGA